jgi:DNA-binding transcriptional regulator YiaG
LKSIHLRKARLLLKPIEYSIALLKKEMEGKTLEQLNMEPSRIRDLRQRLRLTQEDFAHMIGVTFSTVNRWENGKSQPNRIALRLLAGLEKKAKVS